MKILVCLKYIRNNRMATEKHFPYSPHDRNALGFALAIKEQLKNVSVYVISMGPEEAVKPLQDLFCHNVDEVYLISDNAYAGSDTLATTYILANAIKKIEKRYTIQIILCGRNTIDSTTGQVGPGLAQRLDIEYLDTLQHIERVGKCCIYETDKFIVKDLKSKMLGTVSNNWVIPFPRIIDIQRSKSKKIILWNNKDLKLDIDRVGFKGSPTKIVKTEVKYPFLRKKIIVEGDIKEKIIFLQDIIESYSK